ncbi:hypothetical protein BDN72DRAFT_960709 [Pluteus cervinus]|uniref:Uncharacterized protein n=1 Tax=Pluteus cervinus TaxID=181527 RepID=A0ACD3AQ04_9AGAR|nr:hypothetical protein BDN72DRAFT_960709 [Pluteus cervinus]
MATMLGELIPLRAYLDELPLELLLRVLQHSRDDIVTIAQVSRYLNSVAVSYYFPGRSEPHYLNSVILHFDDFRTTMSSLCTTRTVETNMTFTSGDILALLSIAFDIRAVGELVWEFTGVDYADPSRRLVKHYRRLALFLNRLRRVDKISLSFKGRNTRRPSHVIIPPELDGWTLVMTDLMNTCVEKMRMNPNGAEGFEMKGGLPIMGYTLKIPKLGRHWRLDQRVVGFLKNMFKDAETRNPTFHGSGWRVLRRGNKSLSNADANIAISPEARLIAKSTKKFTISAEVFLHPPLCEWTYQFMSSAPLTSLTLEDLRYHKSWWKAMLTWLSNPLQHLEEFTIRNCANVPAPSLARFLRNLRQLKHCIVDIRFKDYPSDLISLDLSNLTTFVAPSNFLYVTRSNRFQRFLHRQSSLSTLCIVLSLQNDYRRVEVVLEAYSNVPWVILDLKRASCFDMEYSEWPTCLKQPKHTLDEKPMIPRCYGVVREVVVSRDVMNFLATTTGFKQRLLEFLGVFKGLKVLRVQGSGNIDKTIITESTTSQTHVAGIAGSGGDDHVYRWVKPPRLDLLKGACGSLEVIELEGTDGKVVLRDFR